MANKKVTDFTSITSAATGDFFYVVDVSDTTDDTAGSSKKITFANLTSTLATSAQGTLADSALQDVVDDVTPTRGGPYARNSKPTTIIATAGESLVAGNLCYFKAADSKYWKADASAEATAATDLLLANATISADATGEFIEFGEWTTTGLTAGTYYMSETAGAITATAPTTSTSIVRIVGTALSTTVFKFKPDTSYVEVA